MTLVAEGSELKMACPLCGHGVSGHSWLGSILYRGRKFEYVECLSCGTLYCDPMPDGEVLSQMYGVRILLGIRDQSEYR